MEEYIVKGVRRLRMGYTTGSCAVGAAAAAATMLLGGENVPAVRISTPKGIPLELEVQDTHRDAGSVTCAVRKDAGDDPDVTDGMLIYARVEKTASGLELRGGTGIGRVTKPGLQCAVGQPAINPVPMRMLREELEKVCSAQGYSGGLRVTVFAPEGEVIAQRTYNPRLGIVGGISILGTSGFVEPMSEAALVGTIRAEMDSKHALGVQTLLLVPGNYGRDFARQQFGIDLDRGVKCSNFLGDALDWAVYKGFEKLVLMGHAGKLVKVAGGIFNTHSFVADARCEILAAHCGLQGCDAARLAQVMDSVTVDAVDELLEQWNVRAQVWNSVADRLVFHLNHRLGGKAEIAFAAFTARGIVMRSKNLPQLLPGLREEDNS